MRFPAACLFDMDGVIVDSAVHHFEAWKRLADALSIPFTEKDNEALKGVSRVDSLEYILGLGHLVLDEATKVKLMDQKNAHYLRLIEGMRAKDILPGAKEFIEECKEAGVAVILGSSSRNAQMVLDNVGLAPLFDAVVDGNHITLSKPDPEVFVKGAQAMNVDPAQCVVFEDAASGVRAGKAGGFAVVGLGDEAVLGEADWVLPTMQGLTLERLCTALGWVD
ncbi:MAG: beta-phosphoglucomutase [Bacteroidetes bacterium]|nr:beta-phosphoglucomutase [Bacteroidota bacterium]MDA0903039.1 beta-phosphoglucomutase [Bacteroidota bacterium]MDA1241751.1 beta-phosphoglucomutase [Bacteroidota bacterium]